MKLFSALLCALTALAAAAFATVHPQLHEVKRVYILAMGSGMDQFLANQLTNAGIFEVVTDPKKADAIITDHVGEAFQRKLDDLYPPPAPPPSKTKPTADATKPAADSGMPPLVSETGASKPSDVKTPGGNRPDDTDLGASAARNASFGRSKGNIFVVDRNSRIVLWSIYERPKDSTPGQLTKTAERVVKHLSDDLTGKKPAE